MKLRARHIHHLEVFTDNVVGLAINYALSYTLLNAMGFPISHSENAILSLFFFIVAYARKYTLRRWFSNWINRIYEARKRDEEIQKQAGEG